jgi:hypothetical protein
VADVLEHVERTLDDALAAGVEGLADRRRVAGERVGRGERVGEELRREAGLGVGGGLQPRASRSSVTSWAKSRYCCCSRK